LALAAPPPHLHPRGDRAALAADGRRAERAPQRPRALPRRRHALLLLPHRSPAPLLPGADAGDPPRRRAGDRAGGAARPPGRGRPPAGLGDLPPLPRPLPAPGPRSLRHLLPPLQP